MWPCAIFQRELGNPRAFNPIRTNLIRDNITKGKYTYGKPISAESGTIKLFDISFNDNLVVTCINNKIKLFDLTSGEHYKPSFTNAGTIARSHFKIIEGKLVFINHNSGPTFFVPEIKIIDLKTRKLEHLITHKFLSNKICFVKNRIFGFLEFSSRDREIIHTLVEWDLNGRQVRIFDELFSSTTITQCKLLSSNTYLVNIGSHGIYYVNLETNIAYTHLFPSSTVITAAYLHEQKLFLVTKKSKHNHFLLIINLADGAFVVKHLQLNNFSKKDLRSDVKKIIYHENWIYLQIRDQIIAYDLMKHKAIAVGKWSTVSDCEESMVLLPQEKKLMIKKYLKSTTGNVPFRIQTIKFIDIESIKKPGYFPDQVLPYSFPEVKIDMNPQESTMDVIFENGQFITSCGYTLIQRNFRVIDVEEVAKFDDLTTYVSDDKKTIDFEPSDDGDPDADGCFSLG